MYKKNNQILVTGLYLDVTAKDLSDALEHIGHVVSVNLDDSAGRAVMEFGTEADAELALRVLRGVDFFGPDLHAEMIGPKPEDKLKRAS